jgi:hypothetical protein
MYWLSIGKPNVTLKKREWEGRSTGVKRHPPYTSDSVIAELDPIGVKIRALSAQLCEGRKRREKT